MDCQVAWPLSYRGMQTAASRAESLFLSLEQKMTKCQHAMPLDLSPLACDLPWQRKERDWARKAINLGLYAGQQVLVQRELRLRRETSDPSRQ